MVEIAHAAQVGLMDIKVYIYLGGGNSNIFGIFTPKMGEDSHFDEHIFQMGWFNHQLDMWNCLVVYHGERSQFGNQEKHPLISL